MGTLLARSLTNPFRFSQAAWQRLLDDHLPGAEAQLRRFLRWKEDYHYFLKKNKGFDERKILDRFLTKRGTCTCCLSKQFCGPMDPYEYTVHCQLCQNELPPFADQMVAMSHAIGEPDSIVAHRNALGLEIEEEREMLLVQEVFIEQIEYDRASIAEGRSVVGGRKHHVHNKDGRAANVGAGRPRTIRGRSTKDGKGSPVQRSRQRSARHK